ncbi:MAG: hypothetical protein WBP70_02610, partial [Terriglobales bacterium]
MSMNIVAKGKPDTFTRDSNRDCKPARVTKIPGKMHADLDFSSAQTIASAAADKEAGSLWGQGIGWAEPMTGVLARSA